MKNNVLITKPTTADVEGIQEVFYKTWLDTYPNSEIGITREDVEERYKNRLDPEKLEERRRGVTNLPADNIFLVAKDDAKVVGVCRFYIKEKFNQLQALYVLPEYQGKGIGRLFWAECLKSLDPSKETIVQVATYNTKAINFYKKLGFADNGKRFFEERHRMPISGKLIPEMEMTLK